MILEVKELTKIIRGDSIIKGISFNIKKGEIVGLLGPNGAGKTTLMRMILGLVAIDSGEVLIDGKPLNRNFEEALSVLGGIIENPDFYPNLTGIENLYYYSRIHGNNYSLDHIIQTLSRLGLQDSGDKKVSQYSLGMRQRLGIAQAVINHPKLLILDEPMNGLDPNGILELRNYLNEIATQNGVAILVSSHLISEVELLCNRVLIMKKGEIEQEILIDNKDKEFNDDFIELNIKVDNLVATESVLNQMIYVETIKYNQSNNRVSIRLNYNNIPKILRELLSQNIDVYEVKREQASLESKFFSVIGGEEIG